MFSYLSLVKTQLKHTMTVFLQPWAPWFLRITRSTPTGPRISYKQTQTQKQTHENIKSVILGGSILASVPVQMTPGRAEGKQDV